MRRTQANPFVAAVFVLVGIGLTIWAGNDFLKAKASAGWPKAKGEITSSRIDTSTRVRRRKGRVRGTSKKYTVNVEYRYSVEGTDHTGDRIAFADAGTGSHARAAEIQKRYDVGAAVDVSYDSENPDVAVLEPGVSTDNYFWLGAGVVVLVVGVLMGVAAVVTRRGECPASSD